MRLHILTTPAKVSTARGSATSSPDSHDISPGTLYPVLHRMEADGLLASRGELVEGRTRRLYRATAAGCTELDCCRDALRELAEEVLHDRDQR